MRVWIQNPFDNLPEEGYRKQRYRLMAEAFQRAGHEVVYFTSDFSHSAKAPRQLKSPVDEPRTVFVPTQPYRRNVSFRRVWSHLAYARNWRRMAAGMDTPRLIVSSMPTISGANAALELGRRFGARVVIDVQDAWPETFERIAPRAMLSPVRALARSIYRRADLVTGVCDRYRELVGRTDYYRAYLGIESAVCTSPRCVGKGGRFVYIGALGRSYDLSRWIRRVESDETLTLDIAANGRIETTCSRIRQHGYLDASALAALLANCDTGIIPMHDDSWVGIPNKFFDYAAAGLRIETSLGGECAALAERWNRGELPWRELDARTIYDDYVRKVTT